MKKYLSFINEINVYANNDDLTSEELDIILSKLDGFDINNAIFYRAHETSNRSNYIALTPRLRHSRTDSNLQNILLSQYDYLPTRVKSITFSDKDTVDDLDFYMASTYRLIPKNNIKIAIAPEKDINLKLVNLFLKNYNYTSNHKFFIQLTQLLARITDQQFEPNHMNFKNDLDAIERKMRLWDYNPKDEFFAKEYGSINAFMKDWLKSGKNFYDYLIGVFDPIEAGYKVVDFTWEKMKDENFRNQFLGKECWIDTPCVLVKDEE